MQRSRPSAAWILLLGLCFASCAAGSAGLARTGSAAGAKLERASGAPIDLDAMARELAAKDVVFLGELHDNDVGHALQLELTRRIVALRPNATLSFEMFERDVQPLLDRYVAGEIDEATFLAGARPWPNYREHYRPLIEFAKEHGLRALAANVPRPLASRVSKEGLAAVEGEAHVPRTVIAPPGKYRRRFAQAMGKPEDSDEPGLALWFLAQCVKDEAMAESIELALCAPPPGRIVIHYCGRFHSDHGLGTVERLLRRQPSLDVAWVTMRSAKGDGDEPAPERSGAGDYVWLVPR